MLPASTCSPPNFLRPSRFDSESRPFLVLPPAFLCAIAYLSNWQRGSEARDAGDFNFGIELTMRALTHVVLAPTEFNDDDFVALTMTLHCAHHFAAGDKRCA